MKAIELISRSLRKAVVNDPDGREGMALEHLATKGFRNRRVGLIENGSWAPAAARLIVPILSSITDK